MGSLRFPRDNPARASRRKENKRGIAGSLRLPRDDPMARYPFVQPDRKTSSGSRGPAGYPAMTQHGHRGVKKTKGGSRGPFGFPAITPRGHRGVSAPSFRDGAIRFFTAGSQGFVWIAGFLRLPRDDPTRASRRKRPFFSRRRDTLFYSRIARLRQDRGVPSVTPR